MPLVVKDLWSAYSLVSSSENPVPMDINLEERYPHSPPSKWRILALLLGYALACVLNVYWFGLIIQAAGRRLKKMLQQMEGKAKQKQSKQSSYHKQ
jgi:hypothetical protein